jgi:hypothetical protein
MIDLLTLDPVDAERITYTNGDTVAAQLFARIAELEAINRAQEEEIEDLKNDSITDWERKNGPAYEYVQFFQGCFDRLAGHYPAPSVTSDYDKSVIFEAIENGTEK